MSAGQPERNAPTPRDAQTGAEPEVGFQMLEQILAHTAGESPQAGFVESKDLAALREVAARYAGQPLSLEPVAVELIAAVLHAQFAKAQLPTATVQGMAAFIAGQLYDDPIGRQRLESLWSRLTAR